MAREALKGYLLSSVNAWLELGHQSLQGARMFFSANMKAKGIVFRGTCSLCIRSGTPCHVMLLCGTGNHCFLEDLPEDSSSSGGRNSGISPVLERLEVNDGAVLQVVPLLAFFCY